MRPIIALLSDFGTRDSYVASMKAAALAACTEATLVDVSHDVPAHDVETAAFTLGSCYRDFPGHTVFVAVVDPGVGSERRGIAMEAGGYRFVGPDNGLFSLVLDEHPDARIHEITNAGLFRHEVSTTFHGRDIFAPVAGHLARGAPLEEVGGAVTDPVRLESPPVHAAGEGEWVGTVVHVDRFGSLVTNVARGDLDRILDTVGGDPTEVVVIVEDIVLPLVRTYADVTEGEPCALAGSSGRLEIAVNRGRASEALGISRGTSVRVRRASY